MDLSHAHSESTHDHTPPAQEETATGDPLDSVSPQAIDHAAEVFKALSTSSRLRILLLLTQRSAGVSEIVDETGLSQPLVSQHLKLLRGLHLVSVERVGREAIYSLADDHVSHVIVDALAHVEE